jgi:D-glycero-D-manno-heptose 1,7-bisphosphate phosphatase
LDIKRDELPLVDIRTVKVQPALCLDLDGTVRFSRRGKFINIPGDIVLFDDVEPELWEYRNNGWLVCGVTNQGGVAFNIKSPQQESAEIEYMFKLFERNPFHLLQSCYHHPGGKHPAFGHRSLFRKPDIGMLAMLEYEAFNAGVVIDWNKSLFVGDRPEDKECAEKASIGFQWAWQFFGREEPVGGND